MDEYQLDALEKEITKEETKERMEEIRKMQRRQERHVLKAAGKALGWAAGAAALFFGGIVGVNYSINERDYIRYDGTRVESRVEGRFGHTRLEEGRDDDVTVWQCSPFEQVTSRAYTDMNGDGRVDTIWIGQQSNPLRGVNGRLYTRDEPSLNFDRADRIFRREIERFDYRRDESDPQ